MQTQCNQGSLEFHPLAGREIRGQFGGGTITGDGGGLLLREVEKRVGSSSASRPALPTAGYRSGSSTRSGNWWGNASTRWCWATKT